MNESPSAADLQLLRKYEPVVRYTQGEMFFPEHTEPYVKRCSLWSRPTEGAAQELISAGSLTTKTLADLGSRDTAGALSLRFVARPLNGAAYQRWRSTRPRFMSRGRLARVGLFGRFVSAIFNLVLLLRGRVPGGTVAAAQQQYQEISQELAEYVYHGRVTRQDGYTVLNYQFFYAMNDWRSSFHGANDHEADWEQIFVYLTTCDDSSLQPAWVAYASHDYFGDDLRRRWDDPELSRMGDHVVVFAGAGSHASYFLPGDYVTEVEIGFLRPLTAISEALRRFWRETLHQGGPGGVPRAIRDLIAVPFVDYARGDGLAIGPGQTAAWSPVLIDEDVDWVGKYKGLWGLDTQDPFAGERAPAGPMYNRDGKVRHSWYDPVDWAGLDNAPLPGHAAEQLRARMTELKREIDAAGQRIDDIRGNLPARAMEVQALRGPGDYRRLQRDQEAEQKRLQEEMQELARQREDNIASLEACRRLEKEIESGYQDPPQAHIRRKAVPQSAQYFSEGRIAELWAAVSTGLLLLGAAAVLAIGWDPILAGLGLLAAALLVDSILRGTVTGLLLNVTIGLALVTAFVLAYEYYWQLSLAGIAFIGLFILLQNLGELRGQA
jgi:hypothetical protein